MKGRPRKPTAVLKLQGTYRHNQRPKDEPTPPIAVPVIPGWLKGRTALAEWKRLAPMLADGRVLTAQDRTMLAAHCQALEDYVRYRSTWAKEGEFLDTRTGSKRPHPALAEMHRAFDRMMKTAACLGLSPADRTRIETIPDEAGGVESIEDFVAKRRKRRG